MASEGGLELAVGDRVVYPGQGVCKVTAITDKTLAGETLTVVALAREEDGAQVLVPKTKISSVGVRKVATTKDVEPVFEYLKAASDDPELDWKVRHRTHQDKVAMGDLMSLAEVVKSLQILSELRPLPQKERERYDNARHLLVREISVALDMTEVNAEDAIDLALIPLGGIKKPRVPKIEALLGAGGDDDLGDMAGDLSGMDVADIEEPEESSEESAEEAEEGEEAEAEAETGGDEEGDGEEAPKRGRPPKGKEPKEAKPPKAPKEKKPKEPKAAKPPKEKKPKEPKPPKAAKEPKEAKEKKPKATKGKK
jgi:RNA polymerase-interacting CarD/CdnL/TRCF family regulator